MKPTFFQLKCVSMVLGLGVYAMASAEVPVQISGMGWLQAGRIMHSTDTLQRNYNGNWFQSVNGYVSALAELGGNWEGELGIGVRQIQKNPAGVNVAQGKGTSAARLQVGVEPYIAKARFTYTYGDQETSPLQVNFGYFPYTYNESVRNLGLYLLRGTVYPGALFSGFETDETIGIANVLGLNLRSRTGIFTHDLLLSSETKIRPLFDYSLAYIGQLKAGSVLELGAGINFYRLFPVNPALTTPRDPSISRERFPDDCSETITENCAVNKLDRTHFYRGDSLGIIPLESRVNPADSVRYDTTRFTFRGIKVGAFFSLDPKAIFGQGALGDADLKLYGEAALIGVKDYPGIYQRKAQRIPIMLGFNLPVFNYLDHLSFEVEWYGSPYRNDLFKLENDYSVIPVSNVTVGREVLGDSIVANGKRFPNADPYNLEAMHKDDWKWSLHGARTFQGHVRVSGQIANDHFRPGGTFVREGFETAFSTLKDWYWMLKLSYLF
jgi:hypothetical protein